MLDITSRWYRFFCYFTLFCFSYTTIFPAVGIGADGRVRITPSSLSQALAQSSAPTAPATEYENHASHAKVITVARQVSQVLADEIVDGELTLSYRVYNNRPDTLKSVLLQTELDASVQVLTSSQPPASGDGSHDLSWVIEELGPFESREISLDVFLNDTSIGNIDNGAKVYADFKARKVSNSTIPAFLIQETIPAEYLTCTVDANCNDPVVIAKAAELGNDPQAIFEYVRDDIAYEVYEGSLRGARGTIWSKAGNAIDQSSLMIALLRASGIPARYADGEISEVQAQSLISTMYNVNRPSTGYFPDDVTEFADPLNNPYSLSQATQHAWVEAYFTGGFVEADPTFQSSQWGDTHTTKVSDFAELDDSLRHKYNVKVKAELLNTLLGGGKPTRGTYLDHSFNTVEVVGKPISLSHLISSTGASGFVFFNRVHTYTPTLTVNDGMGNPQEDEVISGNSYQEVYSNFAGFNEVLIGVFVEMTSVTPSGETTSHERPIHDRGGYAVRKFGGDYTFPDDLGERRAFEPTDVYTMLAGGSFIDENAMVPFADTLRGMEMEVTQALNTYETTEDEADLIALEALMRPSLRMQTSVATLMHAAASDKFIDDLRTSMGVSAYWDRSRILVSHAEANEQGYSFSLDLRQNRPRVEAAPGEPAQLDMVFNSLRGFLEGSLERQVTKEMTGNENIVSTMDVFNQAYAEGIAFEALAQGDEYLVGNFAISQEAKGRILESLAQGKMVVTPVQNVTIGELETVGWYEINPVSGETIAVMENGGHFGLAGYAGMLGENGLNKVAWLIIGFAHGIVEGTFKFLTEFFENVHTAPIDQVLREAKFAVLDSAINKAISEGISKNKHTKPHKNELKAAQCIIKFKPGDAYATGNPFGAFELKLGQEDLLEVIVCLIKRAVSVGIIDPMWEDINKVGKDWYKWGVIAGMLGMFTWFYYSLGVDPEMPPFRVTDFSEPQWYVTGPANIPANTSAGSFNLTGSGNLVSGWISDDVRQSFFTAAAINTVTNNTHSTGDLSNTAANGQLLARAESLNLDGTPIAQAFTAVGSSATSTLTTGYQLSASGTASDIIHPAQSTYSFDVTPAETASFDVQVATSLADDYRIDVEAPLGWNVELNGTNVSVSPKSGASVGTYPVYITVQSNTQADLIVSYAVQMNVLSSLPGVNAEIVPDEIFTIAAESAQLPSAFRLQVSNTGPAADDFSVDFTQVPTGFNLVSDTTVLSIDSGEQVASGFFFQPDGALPAAGTSANFEVTVSSLSDPTVNQVLSYSFVVPEVNELQILPDPVIVAASPGASVDLNLDLQAQGNVTENASLHAQVPAGLSLTGMPSSATLNAGESQSYALGVSLDSALAINQTLRISFVADLCNGVAPESCSVPQPAMRDVDFNVEVRSPTVAGLINAANTASESGFYPLGDELDVLADTLIQLEQDPAATGACETIARTASNIQTVVLTEPSLMGFADAFATLQATAQACDPAQIAVETGDLVGDLVTGIEEYRDYRFTASLYGSKQVLLPGSSASASLAVQNKGEKAITVQLASTSSLDLDVSFDQNGFVLQPQESTTIPVTLSAAVEGDFDYQVQVSATESSQVRQYSGTVVSLLEPYNVMLVDTTPRIINPGDSFQVLSQIVNVANVTAAVDAVTVITPSGDGTPVFESSPGIGLTLPGGNRLDPYTLDLVDTTDWSEGNYNLAVTLYDPNSGAEVGSGATTLYVGAPVRAYANVSPEFVPPGSAQVRTQIELQRFVSGSGTNLGFTPTPLNLDRMNWAAVSQGATFSGTNWSNLYLLNDELGTETNPYVNTTYANATNNPLEIDLGAVRAIDEVEFMLWNGDYRYYQYRLEASEDGVNFVTIADKSTGEHRARQRIEFPETNIRYFRLYGLYNSANGGFHLIEEFRVMGDVEGTPVPAQSIVLDGVNDAGSSYTAGQAVELNAGIYELRYESGALSHWPNDTDNGGKSWDIDYQVEVPGMDKFYRPHFVHNGQTRYASVADAEADNFGASFLLYMPVHGTAHFWYSDSTPTDDRGTLTLSLRQVSGAANTLLPKVRDAMTRSVTWQQRELANWENWGTNGASSACYGCHIQSQGMAGLSESIEKLPDLPIHHSIFDLADSSFPAWQNQAGWVSPHHGGNYRATQTSLWAWSTSYFDEESYLGMSGPVANALDYLFLRQGATGWNYDHSAPHIYSDGQPSATHTAGNIQALSRYLTSDARFERLDEPQVDNPQEIYFAQAEPNIIDVELGQLSGVTGIQMEITDTFASNKNFVINEVMFFNGEQQVAVDAVEASFSQSGYPISETINGVIPNNGQGDGWAHSPRNVTTQPAVGLWVFNTPQNIDRMRLVQRYDASNHKIRRLTLRQTSDAAPTLAAANFSDLVVENIHNGLDDSLVLERLLRAADTFLADTWPYTRNLRTAAQTLIGLNAAMPHLSLDNQQLADAKIQEIEQYLRDIQFEGGWKKSDRNGRGPQPYQTAQALEAILTATDTSVDPNVLAATEYLLNAQNRDGSWTSSDLDKQLAATTWVEIALPTLFELLSSITFRVEHGLPGQDVAVVPNSEWPFTSSDSAPDQLVWDVLMDQTSQTLRVDLALSNLEAGEVVPVSTGTLVEYASVEGSGSFELPPLMVAVKHVLAIDPSTQTTPPGEAVTYFVTIENLLDQSDTFNFEVVGLPEGWTATVQPVTAEPGARITFPIAVTVPISAEESEYNFSVAVESTLGVSDSAGAQLIVDGEPQAISFDTDGVVVDVIPGLAIAGQGTSASYVARVYNTGDSSDTFALSANLPAGLSAEFEQSEVTVDPGYGEYVDVEFTVSAAAGTSASDISFDVIASSTDPDADASSSDTAILRVLPLGVDIAITPDSGAPEDTYTITVTNLGDQADTFDLALGGIVALGATPLPETVALAAGESASWPVTLSNLGVLSEGPALLKAAAISQADNNVADEDAASVVIGPSVAFTASIDPGSVSFVELGTADFNVLFSNLGNKEDAYSIEITQVSGPGVAVFGGPLGGDTHIEEALLPALAEGAVPMSVEMTQYGTAQITVVVRSLTTGEAITLLASVESIDPNDTPQANAGGTYNVQFGESAGLNGSGSSDDGNYQPLAYSWSFEALPAGSGLSDSDIIDANGATPNFTPDVRGEFAVLLTVFDGEKYDYDTARVNVLNNLPVADAGEDINAGVGYNTLIDGSASHDVDNDMITYSWSFISVPVGSVISDADLMGADTAMPNFTPDVEGAFVIELTVTDEYGDSATDQVTAVAAILNVAPNAVIEPEISVPQGDVVQLDGSASNDADGPAALTYQWEIVAVPPGSAITTADIVDADDVYASFVTDAEGDFVVRLTVFDGIDYDSAEGVIHALHVNVAPVADAGSDTAVEIGEVVFVDGSNSFDPDGGPEGLSYQWQFLSVPEFSLLTNTDLVASDSDTVMFTPDEIGNYQLQLTVDDGELFDADSTLVDVLPPPNCAHSANIAISERVIVANKPKSKKGTAAFTQVEFTLENIGDVGLVGPWTVIFDVDPISVEPNKVDGYHQTGRPFVVVRPGSIKNPLEPGRSVKLHVKFMHERDQAFNYNLVLQNVCTPEEACLNASNHSGHADGTNPGLGDGEGGNDGTCNPNNSGH